MKDFIDPKWDGPSGQRELEELRTLLSVKRTLKEQEDILPFFRTHSQLAAFIGSYEPNLNRYDRLATEYPLFGDFACDLVVGDSESKHYVFVEFEDAAPNSVFVTRKGIPEWAPRFERGYSQLLDWFWKLAEMERSPDYQDRFGPEMQYSGLLVIGRTEGLQPREIRRLAWRENRCNINTHLIRCRTFDQLVDDLTRRLCIHPIGTGLLEPPAPSSPGKRRKK